MAKAQAFTLDFIISATVFLLVLAAFFRYFDNIDRSDDIDVQDLVSEAHTIELSVFSSGSPREWNSGNVALIGLTNRTPAMDRAKLREFAALPYQKAKSLFGVRKDFLFYLQTADGQLLDLGSRCIVAPEQYSVKPSYRLAYYYSQSADDFLKDLLVGNYSADIYYKDDADQFYANITRYETIVMEDPHLKSGGTLSDAQKAAIIENASSHGTTFIFSEHVEIDMLNVDFNAPDGNNNATIILSDSLLGLPEGTTLEFNQRPGIRNVSSPTFQVLANYSDGKISIAKWTYGLGTNYFLSDFDTVLGPDNIRDEIVAGMPNIMAGTCPDFDISNISAGSLVKFERLGILDGRLVKAVVIVWA